MSWLTEFDENGDEIEDPWKALDSFIERDVEFHVWIDMAKRLRTACEALHRIYRFSPDNASAAEAHDALMRIEMGLRPVKATQEDIDAWKRWDSLYK